MAGKNIELLLKDVRGSFLNLFEPQENTSESGEITYSYNGAFLFDKETQRDQIDKVRDAIKEAIATTWPGQKITIPADRRCLRDGEPKDPDTGERVPLYDGYEGQMVLSARRTVKNKDAKNPIQIIGPRKGRDGKFPAVGDDLVYSGAYFNILVRIYGFDGTAKKYPNRVNCSLEVVQFKRHGEPFGAKSVDANAVMEEDMDSDDINTESPAIEDEDEDEI